MIGVSGIDGMVQDIWKRSNALAKEPSPAAHEFSAEAESYVLFKKGDPPVALDPKLKPELPNEADKLKGKQ